MSKKTSNLSEKAGVVVFARIITTVIDLAIVIATIQILSKTDFAIIGYLLMIHEVARNLATLGFPDSVFYFFERVSGSAKRAFVNQTTFILMGTALVSALLILVFNQFIPSVLVEWDISGVEQVQNLLPFMALLAVFEIPTWPVTNILLALDRQKESAWYEMLTSVLTFVSLVGPLVLGYDLEIAVYGLTLYGFIRFIGSWIWMKRVLPEGSIQDSEISLRRQVNFSIPLGLSSLVNKINRYVDKFVVSVLLPAAAYAEYTIGAQEVPIIRVIPFAVGSVLISRYVSFQMESKKEELLELWYKGVEKVSLMVVPLTVLSIIIASDLIAIIAESEGTSYRNAVLPFQIYNLIVLIRVTHYGSILQAFDDTRGVFYLSINLMIANLLLSVPLTMWYGIVGTAMGTLIANLYNWYITLRRIGKHMDLPSYRVLPFPFYLKVLGVSAIAALPVWWTRFELFAADRALVGLGFSIVLYLGLFSLLGTILNVIRPDDWKRFKNWILLKFLSS
jgi:O-antigen/teichoic acid export membrane protein